MAKYYIFEQEEENAYGAITCYIGTGNNDLEAWQNAYDNWVVKFGENPSLDLGGFSRDNLPAMGGYFYIDKAGGSESVIFISPVLGTIDRIYEGLDLNVETIPLKVKNTNGIAYAILIENNEKGYTLIFFRSFESYVAGDQTVVDIYGNEYTGTVYTNIENLPVQPNRPPWFSFRYEIITVIFADNQIIQPRNAINWFNDCWDLTTINNISNLDISNTINIAGMFSNCMSLISLDLSTFDISTAYRSISSTMFQGCSALEELNLSSWDFTLLSTSISILGLTELSQLDTLIVPADFGVDYLTFTINLPDESGRPIEWATNTGNRWIVDTQGNPSVFINKNSSHAFNFNPSDWEIPEECISSLNSITLKGDWSKSYAVYREPKIASYYPKLTFKKVNSTLDMLPMNGERRDDTITLGEVSTPYKVVYFTEFWDKTGFSECPFETEDTTVSNIESVNFDDDISFDVKSTQHWFENFSHLTSINLNNVHIDSSEKNISIDYMFNGCSELTSIEWLEEGLISSGESAFKGCSNLRTISIPNLKFNSNEAYLAEEIPTIDGEKYLFEQYSSTDDLSVFSWRITQSWPYLEGPTAAIASSSTTSPAWFYLQFYLEGEPVNRVLIASQLLRQYDIMPTTWTDSKDFLCIFPEDLLRIVSTLYSNIEYDELRIEGLNPSMSQIYRCKAFRSEYAEMFDGCNKLKNIVIGENFYFFPDMNFPEAQSSSDTQIQNWIHTKDIQDEPISGAEIVSVEELIYHYPDLNNLSYSPGTYEREFSYLVSYKIADEDIILDRFFIKDGDSITIEEANRSFDIALIVDWEDRPGSDDDYRSSTYNYTGVFNYRDHTDDSIITPSSTRIITDPLVIDVRQIAPFPTYPSEPVSDFVPEGMYFTKWISNTQDQGHLPGEDWILTNFTKLYAIFEEPPIILREKVRNPLKLKNPEDETLDNWITLFNIRRDSKNTYYLENNLQTKGLSVEINDSEKDLATLVWK